MNHRTIMKILTENRCDIIGKVQNIFKEFWCILTLPIYLCTIPSMWVELFFSSSKLMFILPHQRYLLLVIYAFFNMNDVSWGTREVPKSAADLAAEAENQVWTLWLDRKILEQQPAFVCLSSSNLFWLKAKEVSKAASTKKEGGLLGYFQVNLGIFFLHNLSTSTSVDGGVEEKRQSWILSRQHLLLSMFHHWGPGGLKLRRPLIANFIIYYIGGCQEGDDVDGRQARQDWKGPPHTANTSPNR